MQSSCDRLIEQLKNIDSTLGDLRFKKAYYSESEKTLEVKLVSDVAVNFEGLSFIKNSIEKELPKSVTVLVRVEKSIIDAPSAKVAISKTL